MQGRTLHIPVENLRLAERCGAAAARHGRTNAHAHTRLLTVPHDTRPVGNGAASIRSRRACVTRPAETPPAYCFCGGDCFFALLERSRKYVMDMGAASRNVAQRSSAGAARKRTDHLVPCPGRDVMGWPVVHQSGGLSLARGIVHIGPNNGHELAKYVHSQL